VADERCRGKTVDIVRFEKGKAVEHWGVVDSGVTVPTAAQERSLRIYLIVTFHSS